MRHSNLLKVVENKKIERKTFFLIEKSLSRNLNKLTKVLSKVMTKK